MQFLQQLFKRLERNERTIFYGIALLHLFPVVFFSHYATLDGPAHVYNAQLINDLLSGDPFISGYYRFNPAPVPNWSGHFLLSALLQLFSPETAFRIITGFTVLLLPVGFRYAVRQFYPKTPIASYLIFPFVYTFTFSLGFINFHLGLAFMLIAVGGFMQFRKKPGVRNSLLLFILLIVTYFSHLVPFVGLGIFLALVTAYDFQQALYSSPEQRRLTLRRFFLRTLQLGSICLLPLMLASYYYLHLYDNSGKAYLLKSQLLSELTNLRFLVSYDSNREQIPATLFFLCIFALFIVAFRQRISEISQPQPAQNNVWKAVVKQLRFNDLLLAMAAVFAFLYFRLPDSTAAGGYVSVRLSMLFFLFLLLWISCFSYHRALISFSLIVLTLIQYERVHVYYQVMREQQPLVKEALLLEKQIRPHTVVMPVNYSSLWLHGHLSNYLGYRKPVVILENYETHNTYFPLIWKQDSPMYPVTRSAWNNLGDILVNVPSASMNRVDYIFVLGKDEFPDSVQNLLLQNYRRVGSTRRCLLFERK